MIKHLVDSQAKLACSPGDAIDLEKITFKLTEVSCRKCLIVEYEKRQVQIKKIEKEMALIRSKL